METQLSNLMLLPEYGTHRKHIFPSQASLDWFLRKHRSGLVSAGALLMVTGRWFADVVKFDRYIVSAGAKAAEGKIQPCADMPKATRG